jgi:hypothetical protein
VLFCIFSLQYFGAVYGLIYWFLLYTGTAWTLLQWMVAEHRDRCVLGAYVGFSLCQVAAFKLFLSYRVSYFTNFLVLLTVVLWIVSAVSFIRRKAASLPKSENRALLAQRIGKGPCCPVINATVKPIARVLLPAAFSSRDCAF